MANLIENIDLSNLILSIVSYVIDRGGYVTKTKLIKFLYLIDVEYYRKNRIKLTDFDWIFYKFGPYTNQFEDVYSNLSRGDINIERKVGNEYDADIISTPIKYDLNEVVTDPSTSLMIKKILNRWAKERLSKLLDFVYFETEPMENARKLERLDFTTILPETDEVFYLKKSKIKPKKLKQLRQKLKDQISNSNKGIPASEFFSSSNYNSNYIDDILKMDSGEIT